jgi:hypothetical protein
VGNGLRYVCIALGAILLLAGWAIISAGPVKQEAIRDVGGFVASRMLGAPGADGQAAPNPGPQAARRITWRELVLQAATTTYAAGIAGVILGAALLGFGVPAPSKRHEPSTKQALFGRPDLLMFLAAGFLFLSGFLLTAIRGFEGGFSLFGYRSAIALAVCGGLAALMRRVKVIGLAGYYAGLLVAALVALNLLRLAWRAATHGNAFESQTLILILTAVGGLAAFIFIWRAIPGGLDRARLMIQLQRVAAGAGAAAIITGVCIFKSGLLPQQAVAEFTNPTAMSETAITMLDDLVRGERAEAILQDPEARRRLIESDVGQELIAAALESPDLAASGEDAPRRAPAATPPADVPPGPAGDDPPAAAAPMPFTPPRLADLLNELSTADIQELLDAADIRANATDDRVPQKIREYGRRLSADDPRLTRRWQEILDATGGERAGAPNRTPTDAWPSSTSSSKAGDQSAPQRESTRINPRKFDLLVHATRSGGESGAKPRPPRSSHGPPPQGGGGEGERPLSESPASQEIMSKLAQAKQAQADGASPIPAIEKEANGSADARPRAAEPEPATSKEPEAQAGEPARGAAEGDEAIEPASRTTPPPPPPDLDSLRKPNALESITERATLAADRIGLIAVAIGAATVLAVILLRRFHRRQPQAESADR